MLSNWSQGSTKPSISKGNLITVSVIKGVADIIQLRLFVFREECVIGAYLTHYLTHYLTQSRQVQKNVSKHYAY